MSGLAVFLDRDGTINVKAPAGSYIQSPDQLELLAGASGAIRALNDAGRLVVVVTNQRGIALGRMTEDDLAAVHAKLARRLAAQAGAHLDAILHCPHDIGRCRCRKPAPGLIDAACRRLPQIDLGRSVLIGDSAADVGAGRRAGVATIRLGKDAADLSDAVDRLLSGRQATRPRGRWPGDARARMTQTKGLHSVVR